jgi:hypothetical protein
MLYKPTAVQAVRATHDTAVNSLWYLTAGRVSLFQPLPFQAMLGDPTAMQNVFETHETPDNRLPRTDPAGVAVRAQRVPFQVSTRARALTTLNPLPAFSPTATQNLADAHDTDTSSGFTPATGVGSTVQDEPFQRSADVASGSSGSWKVSRP